MNLMDIIIRMKSKVFLSVRFYVLHDNSTICIMYFACIYISRYLNYVHGIVAGRMRIPM